LDAIFNNEFAFRIGFFLGILLIIALWETVAPRRNSLLARWKRWPSNLGMMALNTVLLRFLFPVAAVGMAINASTNSWGLLNLIELPFWLEMILTIILFDAAVYFQHLLFHSVPILWKMHRVHHTDTDFDVTTGGRFHPLEMILSMLIKMSFIIIFGASPVSVIVFEILLNSAAMFNHGNIRITKRADSILRLFIVTPDMHRVHHSVMSGERNSNFGFNLPWWDHLFKTYCAQPEAGHEIMTIGINVFRDPKDQRFDNLLTQPLKGNAGDYPKTNRPNLT
jgi:sterol desaturase/sphingolipid hydroxylase (fatty acid hydroxylase superfamily)